MSPAARARRAATREIAAALSGLALAGCAIEIADVECTEGVGAPPQEGCSEWALDCNCEADDACEVDARGDASNCGWCGHDCGGGACIDGRCQPAVIAALEAPPHDLVLSVSSVFVGLEGAVVRVDVAGGTSVTVTATGENPVFGVDADYLYWASDGEAALRRVPLGGGTAEELAAVTEVGGLALDGEAVYWTDDGEVRRVAKGGGPATSLGTFTNALLGIAVDDAQVFFFRGTTNGQVYRVDKSGKGAIDLVGGGLSIGDLALDETRVYFTLLNEGPHRIDKTGTQEALLASRPGARSVAVDSTDVYFATGDGEVLRVPKSGGEAVIVAADQTGLGSLAVDDRALFWTRATETDGSLVRLSK